MRIINVGNAVVNTYLLSIGEDWLLIDTGYKQTEKKFWEKLAENKIAPTSIKYVFLTHHHADHSGFLKNVLEKTGATLLSSPDNARRLKAGKNDLQSYISGFFAYIGAKAATFFMETMQCFPPVDEPAVDPMTQPLADYGVTFGKFSGHTDCDMVLFADGKLFCGDLFMCGPLCFAHAPLFIKNKFSMITSWEKLAETGGFSVVYPGHGKPFSASKIKDSIRNWKTKGVLPLNRTKQQE